MEKVGQKVDKRWTTTNKWTNSGQDVENNRQKCDKNEQNVDKM